MSSNNDMSDATYLPELMAEKDSIDPSFVHAVRLITNEIEKIKNPSKSKNSQEGKLELYDIFDPKFPKVVCNLKIPAEDYPKVNFIGRIIGPGGSTLKGIQEVTNTKIAVLGKGSVRDKKRQEEIAAGNEDKLAHLKHPLHVRISAVGPVEQAYVNIGRACSELAKLMQVDEEEYNDGGMQQRQNRMSAGRGGRGMSSPFQRGRGGGGRGGPTGSSQRGARGGGRGGSGRGTGRGSSRGASRGTGRGGSSLAAKSQRLQQVADPYASQMDEYGGGYEYGDASYDAYSEYVDPAYDQAYLDSAYGADAYGDASYGSEAYDAYSYGEAFDAYGNGAADATPVNTSSQYGGSSKPFRGKMRGSGRGRASAKPY